MANGTGDPRGFNKVHSSKFRERSRIQQTPEEVRRTYRPKRCANNNKDEDNILKTFNDKDLFEPGVHCLICHYFEFPKNKYFCKI